MAEVLSVEDVVKDYRRGTQTVRALDEVSLAVHPGEFVSVLGPSGSGKSTLLHLMGALDTPTAGRVRIGGVDIAGLSDDELTDLRRHRLGFVFQFFNLLPTMSAWENVAVPLLLDGRRLNSLKGVTVPLLEALGLGHRVDHRPAELSGGSLIPSSCSPTSPRATSTRRQVPACSTCFGAAAPSAAQRSSW